MTFTVAILNVWCDLIQNFSVLTDLGKNIAGDISAMQRLFSFN